MWDCTLYSGIMSEWIKILLILVLLKTYYIIGSENSFGSMDSRLH